MGRSALISSKTCWGELRSGGMRYHKRQKNWKNILFNFALAGRKHIAIPRICLPNSNLINGKGGKIYHFDYYNFRYCCCSIINQKKEEQELKNGIVVIATVKYTGGGRGAINVHVQYERNGKIINNVFGTYNTDSFKN